MLIFPLIYVVSLYSLRTEAVENWRIAKLHEANQMILGQENVTLAISSDEAGVLNRTSHSHAF